MKKYLLILKEGRLSWLKLQTFILVKGKRRITADTALRLAKYFGTKTKFWLGLQNDYDIEEESVKLEGVLENIPIIA